MKDANTIIEESVSQRKEVYSHLREAADFFHEHEGTFFERGEAIAQLSDELSIEQDIAGQVIAELVGDIVDPVVLSAVDGEKYVGVVEFEEFDGAYGYVDYHDVRGPDKRVVCQQCVNEASLDTQVAHATAGDPSGTVASGADYDELLDIVHEHYADSHEVVPKDVSTGATLASGTTIGGNESWHAGNDGSGSGLDADVLQGNDPSSFASDNHGNEAHAESYITSGEAPVQSVNSQTGDVVVQTGATVQESAPTNPQEGDLWVDTSGAIQIVKWYNGTNFIPAEARTQKITTSNDLPETDPPQIIYVEDTDEYMRSLDSTPWDISTASYTGVTLNSQDTYPRGLEWKPDGTLLFEIDANQDNIYEYQVSTPWDISTASYTGATLNTQDTSPRGFGWKPDGTLLFEVDGNQGNINEYQVSTPWDISTASSTGTSINTQNTPATSIAWKPDGTLLFELGYGNTIYEYQVSTPWDISTASYTGTSVNTKGFATEDMAWKPDGTLLFVCSDNDDRTYEIDVSTPWDISTASYTGTSIETPGSKPSAIEWKPDGTLLFQQDSSNEKIYEYKAGYEIF